MDNQELINKAGMGSITPILSDDGKYIYLYKTTCLVNNKIYIGVHKYKGEDPAMDPYIGKGISKNNKIINFYPIKSDFINAVREYGASNFKKEILLYFKNLPSALFAERQIVDEDFVASDMTYNMTIGGGMPPRLVGDKNGNWGNHWTEDQKKSLSKKKKDLGSTAKEKNPKATPCILYDFLTDTSYKLRYMREVENFIDGKLDYNWNSLMKYRYLFIKENEDPYKEAEKRKKPMETLTILSYIKKGYSYEECVRLSGVRASFASRVYNTINNESRNH